MQESSKKGFLFCYNLAYNKNTNMPAWHRKRGIIMKLQETRLKYRLTQEEAANIAGVPLRTYVRYDNDDEYGNILKRERMVELLIEECEITEEKGLLTIAQIKEITSALFEGEYNGFVECCYLFGSYAKGYAKPNSDVDLCVMTDLTGLKFVGLANKLREALHKRVDLIRIKDLSNNMELTQEILKDGIRIYRNVSSNS